MIDLLKSESHFSKPSYIVTTIILSCDMTCNWWLLCQIQVHPGNLIAMIIGSGALHVFALIYRLWTYSDVAAWFCELGYLKMDAMRSLSLCYCWEGVKLLSYQIIAKWAAMVLLHLSLKCVVVLLHCCWASVLLCPILLYCRVNSIIELFLCLSSPVQQYQWASHVSRTMKHSWEAQFGAH